MKFRTEYTGGEALPRIDADDKIMLVGSCFSDYIGGRMARAGMDVLVNPCGTLFNPASIAGTLRMSLRGSEPDPVPVTMPERWISWDFATRWAGTTREECVAKCRKSLELTREHLHDARCLIVTFGTAWVYELADEPGRVVANCHKLPEKTFVRRRLSVDEIVNDWSALLAELRSVNPGLQVIFTISPVRHLRDGFAGNSLSKSVLRVAVDGLTSSDEGVWYFPSYEIMTDDLRDYRYYGADLVHPGEQGVEYIWEKFSATCMDDGSRSILKERETAIRRSQHREING